MDCKDLFTAGELKYNQESQSYIGDLYRYVSMVDHGRWDGDWFPFEEHFNRCNTKSSAILVHSFPRHWNRKLMTRSYMHEMHNDKHTHVEAIGLYQRLAC